MWSHYCFHQGQGKFINVKQHGSDCAISFVELLWLVAALRGTHSRHSRVCDPAASIWLQGSVCSKGTGAGSEEKKGKTERREIGRPGEEMVLFLNCQHSQNECSAED